VGLTSAFLPFGNSWLTSSHRLKDHPWNSTTSYDIKSSPFLATLQSLLLQATRQQSRKTYTSSTSTKTIQLPQCPRHFKLPIYLSRKVLVPLPTSSKHAGTSSRGRARKMSRAMAEPVSQREFIGNDKMNYMAAQAVTEHDCNRAHNENLSLQDRMRHPIAFLSEMLGDVMHLHQALRQPDSRQFVDSVIKKNNGHVNQKHWEVTPRADVPKDTDILLSIWTVRRRCNLTTGKITKHKSPPESSRRRKAGIWNDLLRHLSSCHHLVRNPLNDCIWNTILMFTLTS
jgi:hypothetical protein